MQYKALGTSGIQVSEVCLGTMTWGRQNNQQEANEQLDYALEQGINFMDTAEMYAIPPNSETYGKTETIIGNYLAANSGTRDKWVIATKIVGPGLSYIRGGSEISGETLKLAVEDSLIRLQTDYIDLYQLHWPNRTSPHFGKHQPGFISFSDVDTDAETEKMLDILQAAQDCIQQGKIRHLGLSNETPWGIQQYLRLSREHNLPRIVSIQNEFNLIHTKDWPFLLETCVRENIAYLPWSPLAGGALSGKYIDGARPAGSRWSIAQRNGLFRDTPEVNAAIKEYVAIAEEHKITPSQLALAWCRQIDGVTSTIIGATKMSQLREDIEAFEIEFGRDTESQVNKIVRKYPLPY